MSAGRLFADHALLPGGWAAAVRLEWDAAGTLTTVAAGSAPPAGAPRAAGPLLPGMPNLHSHAFQRVFAGLAEHRSAAGADSFWTWRDLMYRVALAVSPEQLQAIATQLYIEMLGAGYTAVCEFHYLHHDPQGRSYADPAEMALRLVAAAAEAGIGLTLLPVLYQDAGFGGQPARPEQRRFVNGIEALLRIAERVRTQAPAATVGVAPHSLRAVGPAALRELLAGWNALAPGAPVHVHIAEQAQEVADCLAWSGQRPVEFLLAHASVDARWCLVHATHLVPAERRALAASGAVAGLCPSTEANLGDGVFDAAAYLGDGGTWGIGSDSHACVGPADELRGLEYSQRLVQQRRSVLAGDAGREVAENLWLGAVHGGARASGRPLGGLAVGQRADLVVLDVAGVRAGLTPAQALSSHLFAPHGGAAVRDVWVGGHQRIHAGEHARAGVACADFIAARRPLLDAT